MRRAEGRSVAPGMSELRLFRIYPYPVNLAADDDKAIDETAAVSRCLCHFFPNTMAQLTPEEREIVAQNPLQDILSTVRDALLDTFPLPNTDAECLRP